MSYADMDHARWLERNAEASRAMQKKPSKDRDGRVVGWHAVPATLNPFQARVATIIGISFGGIYNAPVEWTSALWADDYAILTLRPGDCGLATVDHNALTRMVFLCHDARIRGSVLPGMNRLRLGFWHRDDAASLMDGHPNLMEAVRDHQAYIRADHPVRYQQERDSRAAERAEWRRQAEEARAERERRAAAGPA